VASNTVQIVVNLQDNASRGLSGITSGLQGMMSVAGGIIAADVFGRIASGIGGVVTAGFGMASQVENLSARLNAFTKDGEKTAEMLAWAREEAEKTPFAYSDIGDAIASVLPVANALGVDYQELIRTGEVLSALNPMEGISGGVFSLKEALQGDFVSIAERFGLDKHRLRELRDEGVPILQAVQQVLGEMGADMDLVSNQSNTTSARIDRFKESIVNLSTAFATPIFDFFSEQLGLANDTLAENMPAIEERLRGAGQFIADTFQTITEAWNGQWVDSEMIQPMHRLAGTLTQDVKAGLETVQGLWDRAREFWESGWIQSKILEPLANLATQIRDTFVKDWEKLKGAWDKLHTVGDSWNGLMIAGQGLWDTLVGAVRAVGEALGIASTKGGDNNKAMKDANPLITGLIGLFDGVARFATLAAVGINLVVAGLKAFVDWINRAIGLWRDLQGAVAAGTPTAYPEGVPVGGTDVGGTGSTTTGGTTVGGGVPVGERGAMSGGVVIYATVRNDQDIHALAYEISKVQKANR
jgi:hypothetical protein